MIGIGCDWLARFTTSSSGDGWWPRFGNVVFSVDGDSRIRRERQKGERENYMRINFTKSLLSIIDFDENRLSPIGQ